MQSMPTETSKTRDKKGHKCEKGRKEPTLREQKEKFCAANATDKRGLAVSQVQLTPLLLMQESQVTEDGKGQPESACCTSPQEETLPSQ